MIKELEINNFQSHKKTVLEFEPGVNVIIGPSDSGKTSLIRALRWIAWNRPLGDAFRSNWGGDTSGIIRFEDCEIERFKGKNDYYELYDPFNPNESDVLKFEAFGTEVPTEIKEALNLSEINLQEQMDSPFLISDNPGQVSRHFNKVANIDKIDSSQKNVESWIRDINSNKKAAEAEIERLEKELKEFDYLDKMEAEIEVLEGLESRKNNIASKATRLADLINSIDDVVEEIKIKSKLLPAGRIVNRLLELYKAKQEKIDQKYDLRLQISKINEVKENLEAARELTKDEDIVNKILQLFNKKSEVEEKSNKLRSKIFAIKAVVDAIKDEKEHLEELEEQWHKVAPEACPLCGAEMQT